MTEPGPDALFALAERHAEAGDWSAARREYLRVLALDPRHADAMLQLSYAESVAGRYRAAHGWTLRATQADPPTRPDGMLDMVRRLRTFNEARALRDYAVRLLGDPRVPAAVLVEAARQLSNLNESTIAMQCVDAARRKAPADPAIRLVRGQLLAHQGCIDEAEAEIESVLHGHPRIAIGWWMLSRLRKQAAAANHVPQLQALLRTPGLSPADVAALARALHKELDDIGDHEGAWQALETMCRARRGSLRYDARWSRELVDALVAWSGNVAAAAPTPPGAIDDGGRIPVFIIGMHRSGTTLLEQLLDAGGQVRGVGEANDSPAAMRDATDHACRGTVDLVMVQRAAGIDFGAVGRAYMAGMAWRLGDERWFTDKQPANFLNAGFIGHALPQAKILHLVRDPMETCFSNLRELFSGTNEYSYDQRELADYFLQYRRLMAHWHAALPGRILDVSYERLTCDPEATMREVAAHCGIAYVPAMSDPRNSKRVVSTASSVQVREGVVRRATPKWAPYARHLQPLAEALREGGVDVPGPPPFRP